MATYYQYIIKVMEKTGRIKIKDIAEKMNLLPDSIYKSLRPDRGNMPISVTPEEFYKDVFEYFFKSDEQKRKFAQDLCSELHAEGVFPKDWRKSEKLINGENAIIFSLVEFKNFLTDLLAIKKERKNNKKNLQISETSDFADIDPMSITVRMKNELTSREKAILHSANKILENCQRRYLEDIFRLYRHHWKKHGIELAQLKSVPFREAFALICDGSQGIIDASLFCDIEGSTGTIYDQLKNDGNDLIVKSSGGMGKTIAAFYLIGKSLLENKPALYVECKLNPDKSTVEKRICQVCQVEKIDDVQYCIEFAFPNHPEFLVAFDGYNEATNNEGINSVLNQKKLIDTYNIFRFCIFTRYIDREDGYTMVTFLPICKEKAQKTIDLTTRNISLSEEMYKILSAPMFLHLFFDMARENDPVSGKWSIPDENLFFKTPVKMLQAELDLTINKEVQNKHLLAESVFILAHFVTDYYLSSSRMLTFTVQSFNSFVSKEYNNSPSSQKVLEILIKYGFVLKNNSKYFFRHENYRDFYVAYFLKSVVESNSVSKMNEVFSGKNSYSDIVLSFTAEMLSIPCISDLFDLSRQKAERGDAELSADAVAQLIKMYSFIMSNSCETSGISDFSKLDLSKSKFNGIPVRDAVFSNSVISEGTFLNDSHFSAIRHLQLMNYNGSEKTLSFGNSDYILFDTDFKILAKLTDFEDKRSGKNFFMSSAARGNICVAVRAIDGKAFRFIAEEDSLKCEKLDIGEERFSSVCLHGGHFYGITRNSMISEDGTAKYECGSFGISVFKNQGTKVCLSSLKSFPFENYSLCSDGQSFFYCRTPEKKLIICKWSCKDSENVLFETGIEISSDKCVLMEYDDFSDALFIIITDEYNSRMCYFRFDGNLFIENSEKYDYVINSIDFSSENNKGRYLISSSDGILRLFSYDKSLSSIILAIETIPENQYASSMESALFCDDRQHIVSGCLNRAIYEFSADTLYKIGYRSGSNDGFQRLCFLNNKLYASTYDGSCCVIDIESKRIEEKINLCFPDWAWEVCPVSDDKIAVSSSQHIYLIDTIRNKPFKTIDVEGRAEVIFRDRESPEIYVFTIEQNVFIGDKKGHSYVFDSCFNALGVNDFIPTEYLIYSVCGVEGGLLLGYASADDKKSGILFYDKNDRSFVEAFSDENIKGRYKSIAKSDEDCYLVTGLKDESGDSFSLVLKETNHILSESSRIYSKSKAYIKGAEAKMNCENPCFITYDAAGHAAKTVMNARNWKQEEITVAENEIFDCVFVSENEVVLSSLDGTVYLLNIDTMKKEQIVKNKYGLFMQNCDLSDIKGISEENKQLLMSFGNKDFSESESGDDYL